MTELFYGSVLYTMTADIKLNFPYILVDIYLSVCLEAVEFKLTQIRKHRVSKHDVSKHDVSKLFVTFTETAYLIILGLCKIVPTDITFIMWHTDDKQFTFCKLPDYTQISNQI